MVRQHFFDKQPLLIIQVIGWTVYWLADLFDHYAKGHYLFFPTTLCSFSAFILTGVVAYWTNKLGSKGLKAQGTFFVVSMLVVTVTWHKIWMILHGDDESYAGIVSQFIALRDYSFAQWLTTGYYPLFLFLAWSGFYVGCKWYFAHHSQQLQLNDAKLSAKQAQLHTLRYQLNPHFLFNVLNSIDVSIHRDDKATARKMIQHLSRFLRSSLQQGEQDKIPLQEEIAVLRDFVNIEQVRFGDGLSIAMEIDGVCNRAMVPPMLLQPLVENAIKFAWSQNEKGHVCIRATKESSQLKIEIENSIASIKPDYVGTGTGLKNTQERLELIYGNKATIQLRELSDKYSVNILLPWEELLA